MNSKNRIYCGTLFYRMLMKWRSFIFAVVTEMNGGYFDGENVKNLGFMGFLKGLFTVGLGNGFIKSILILQGLRSL